jgi:GNAT superfamily N-acetyltransferase
LLAHQRARPELPADGLIELPPNKIAAVATYLDLRRPASLAPPDRSGLEPLAGDLARYRALYRAVGETWLWFSRAGMPDQRLRAIIDDPRVDALALVKDGRDVGMVEMDFRQPGLCELAFLGLVEGEVGQGLGRRLIEFVIAHAFCRTLERPVERLWVHTCTLDHPAALPLYVSAGFRAFKRAVEIADDPRLTGLVRLSAAPHAPVLGRVAPPRSAKL